jgi:hypothetical protein
MVCNRLFYSRTGTAEINSPEAFFERCREEVVGAYSDDPCPSTARTRHSMDHSDMWDLQTLPSLASTVRYPCEASREPWAQRPNHDGTVYASR